MTKIALKGFLAQKLKDEGTVVDDLSQLNSHTEAGNKATQTVCQYVDWLLSTRNPNPPDEDMWIHPCQRQYKDIPNWDIDSDYVDLLNTVQGHTSCSTSYCLRKKGTESELKCRFNFPLIFVLRQNLSLKKSIARTSTKYSTEQKL